MNRIRNWLFTTGIYPFHPDTVRRMGRIRNEALGYAHVTKDGKVVSCVRYVTLHAKLARLREWVNESVFSILVVLFDERLMQRGAIALGANGGSAYKRANNWPAPTFNMTPGAANLMMFIGVEMMDFGGGGTLNAATWAGSDVTTANSRTYNNAGGYTNTVLVGYTYNPAQSANAVSVNVSSNSGVRDFVVNAATFSGTASTIDASNTATGNGTSCTLSLTTGVDSAMTYAAALFNNNNDAPSSAPGSGYTELHDYIPSGGTTSYYKLNQSTAGAKTVNNTWSGGSGNGWALVAVSCGLASSGTNWTQTCTETETHTDTLANFHTFGAVLSDTITHTASLVRTMQRALADTITHTDTFTKLRSVYTTLTDTVTHADTFVRGAGKVLAEVVTHTDALIRGTVRTLIETVTHTDATVSMLKVFARAYTETVTHTDSIIRAVARTFTETVAHVDSLVRTIARTLVETITHTDSDTNAKVKGAALIETTTTTDALSRSIGRILSETVTHDASFWRGNFYTFTETVTHTASAFGIKARLLVTKTLRRFPRLFTLRRPPRSTTLHR